MSKKKPSAATLPAAADRGRIQVVLLHHGAVVSAVPQWVKTPGGDWIAFVALDGGAPALAPPAPRAAAPVADIGGPAEDDERAITFNLKVLSGQVGEEHYERVRKGLQRRAAQDGVSIGEAAFTVSGGMLIGKAAVLPADGVA